MKPSKQGMRIWYQSFTDPKETHRYHKRLTDYLASVAAPGTTIDVVGMTPPSRRHRTTELRCAVDVVKNAIRAGREGYDAFLLGHFQDSGLWDARSATAIPVIGLGESAMLHACTLGRKIALITIHPIHIPYHEEQILRYGLQQRVVHVAAVESYASDYVTAFGDPKAASNCRAPSRPTPGTSNKRSQASSSAGSITGRRLVARRSGLGEAVAHAHRVLHRQDQGIRHAVEDAEHEQQAVTLIRQTQFRALPVGAVHGRAAGAPQGQHMATSLAHSGRHTRSEDLH